MCTSVVLNLLLCLQINTTDPLVAPPAGQTQYTPDQIHVTMAREHPATPARALACLCACSPCTSRHVLYLHMNPRPLLLRCRGFQHWRWLRVGVLVDRLLQLRPEPAGAVLP